MVAANFSGRPADIPAAAGEVVLATSAAPIAAHDPLPPWQGIMRQALLNHRVSGGEHENGGRDYRGGGENARQPRVGARSDPGQRCEAGAAPQVPKVP